jgi:hypothetical protein
MHLEKIEEDLVWLAGLFEGEGTVGLFKTMRGATKKWRISVFFLVANNDPIIAYQVYSIAKKLSVNLYIKQRPRPENKDWNLSYHVSAVNMADTHKMIAAVRPYLRASKAAIADMTLQFIESRNYGMPFKKGPGTSYSDEDWALYESVKKLNQHGQGKQYESSETLRSALEGIERAIQGDDKVQTSVKIGEDIPEQIEMS